MLQRNDVVSTASTELGKTLHLTSFSLCLVMILLKQVVKTASLVNLLQTTC